MVQSTMSCKRWADSWDYILQLLRGGLPGSSITNPIKYLAEPLTKAWSRSILYFFFTIPQHTNICSAIKKINKMPIFMLLFKIKRCKNLYKNWSFVSLSNGKSLINVKAMTNKLTSNKGNYHMAQ